MDVFIVTVVTQRVVLRLKLRNVCSEVAPCRGGAVDICPWAESGPLSGSGMSVLLGWKSALQFTRSSAEACGRPHPHAEG